MPGWNLALRFVLELVSVAGIGAGVASKAGWLFGSIAMVAAFALWGTFATPGDPSRSGKAPVPVDGHIRLVVEEVVFGGGIVGWVAAGRPLVAILAAVGLLVHHAFSLERLRWLVAQRRSPSLEP